MHEYTPSPAAVAMTQEFEHCLAPVKGKPGLLEAYLDPRKIWTIGWGSIYIDIKGSPRRRVVRGDIISKAQADSMFLDEYAAFSKQVNYLLTVPPVAPAAMASKFKVPTLRQCQFDALMDFAYNLGTDIDQDTKAEGLGDSTLLKLVWINPDDPAIGAEFEKWRNKGSSFERGLWRRRKAEAWLYFTGQSRYQFPEPYRLIDYSKLKMST